MELQRNVLPKTDSVEIKESSVYLDKITSGPKLDSSQTNLGNAQVPSALLPGVPFREKVELPKNLPNGNSVDSGVANGDLGFGKTRPGANHFGIDMKGNEIRNQLNDALKLREGSQGSQSTAPPSGTFDHTGLVSQKTDETYHAGFKRPGMNKVSVEAPYAPPNPGGTLVNLPRIIEKVTGRAADFLDGVKALFHPEERLKKIEESANEENKKYVNPDADANTRSLESGKHVVDVRFGSNKDPIPPGVDDGGEPIVVNTSEDHNPLHKPLVSDPVDGQLEHTATPNQASLELINVAKGPDTVNPNDPDIVPPDPPKIPNR